MSFCGSQDAILMFSLITCAKEFSSSKSRNRGHTISKLRNMPAGKGGGGTPLLISHIGMYRPKGYSFGTVLVYKGTTVVYDCVRRS